MAGLFSFLFGRKKQKKAGSVKYKSSLVFEVSGTAASYNVTHTTAESKILQKQKVEPGYTYRYEIEREGYFYFSAQSNTKDSKIHVKAIKDGEVIKEDYKIVTIKLPSSQE